MKTNAKRIVSFLLTLCLVMGFMIPAVWAAETKVSTKQVDYSFKYGESITISDSGALSATGLGEIGDAYEAGDINSMICSSNLSAYPAIVNKGIGKSSLQSGNWYAFKIKNPGSGTFKVRVLPYSNRNGTESLDVYILDGSTTDIEGSLVEANHVGNCNIKETTAVKSLNDYTFDSNVKDYLVVFKIGGTGLTGKTMPLAGFRVFQYYYSAADAAAQITNAPLGTTITLNAACEANTAVSVGAGVTVDMNGKNLTADVNIVDGGILKDSAATPGVLTGTLAASGSNGGYLPLKNGTGYSFYAAAVNVASAENGVLKFNATFTNTAAYALLAADTSAQIGGEFVWTVNGGEEKTDKYDITYENMSLAQKWGQMVGEKGNANGRIVLTFAGLEGFDALSVAPYIESAGVTIQADAQTLKSAS